MSPLWITLHWCWGGKQYYYLQTHFVQPIRTGTKRECNYEWYSQYHTHNEYKNLSSIPTPISDLIKEASTACGVSPNTLHGQFTSGEVALKISEQGVTVYKPYDKSKNKAQGTVNEPMLHSELPAIKDTIQSDPLLPAIEIKTQLYDAETLTCGQKCESFI